LFQHVTAPAGHLRSQRSVDETHLLVAGQAYGAEVGHGQLERSATQLLSQHCAGVGLAHVAAHLVVSVAQLPSWHLVWRGRHGHWSMESAHVESQHCACIDEHTWQPLGCAAHERVLAQMTGRVAGHRSRQTPASRMQRATGQAAPKLPHAGHSQLAAVAFHQQPAAAVAAAQPPRVRSLRQDSGVGAVVAGLEVGGGASGAGVVAAMVDACGAAVVGATMVGCGAAVVVATVDGCGGAGVGAEVDALLV
jgi:hypothetical protein